MRRHRVLISEDDPTLGEMLVEIVEMLGHEAVLVTTFEEEREAILQGGFCYVLQDLHMPMHARAKASPLSGQEGAAWARKHNPERTANGYWMPIIAVTSLGDDPAFGVKLSRAGVDWFIKKPFGEPENVHAVIRDALAAAGRADHEDCVAAATSPAGVDASRGGPNAAPSPTASAAAERNLLAVGSVREDSRTTVMMRGKPVRLVDQYFALLVRLVDIHLKTPGKHTSRKDLGLRTREVTARLNACFREAGAIEGDFLVVESNGKAECRLNPAIHIGHVDWHGLVLHADDVVRKIAETHVKKRAK